MNRKYLFLVILLVIIVVSVLFLPDSTMGEHKKYLLIPVPKNPYSRIGPVAWQDWYRQTEETVELAHELQNRGNEVVVAIISHFQAKGKPSEIEIYTEALKKLDPDLDVRSYKEDYLTIQQVQRSSELKKELGADELVFVSTWMHYPRVLYLARHIEAEHYASFGIPHPIFGILDPIYFIFEPIVNKLGVDTFFYEMTKRHRAKGEVL